MNVLVVGSGSGSWTMRGLQLGDALGARVTDRPRPQDWAWAERAVLVKRAGAWRAEEARQAGVPFVWDALDCWRQPFDNPLDGPAHQALLRSKLAALQPAQVIGATQAQADAAGGVYLPHHSWLGLEPTDPRPAVRLVAYQGNASYLGAWRGRLERACAARGWAFLVDPPDLRLVDIVVALREGPWDGWACREWKSGVKLVNALAAGRPVLCQPSAAWREIAPPGTALETEAELGAALDAWSAPGPRLRAAERGAELAPAYTIDAVAGEYRRILEATTCPTV